MPATPARIGFILNERRRAVAESDTIKARYGADARQSADPIPSYFDTVEDAEAIANERQALLSAERRRFKVTASAVDDATAIDLGAGVPVVRYIDTERDADRSMLLSEIVIDLSRQSVTMTIWG